MSEKIEHPSLNENGDIQETTDKRPGIMLKRQHNEPDTHLLQPGDNDDLPQQDTPPDEEIAPSDSTSESVSSEEDTTTQIEKPDQEDEAEIAGVVPIRTSTPPPPTFRSSFKKEPDSDRQTIEVPDFMASTAGRKNLVTFLRVIVSSILLVIVVSNALMLLSNLTPTHLNLYAFNPANGTLQAQNDLGVINEATKITTPVQTGPSIVLGTHSNTIQAAQSVLTLTGQDTSWHIHEQFSTSFSYTTLHTTSDSHVITAGKQGLQAFAPNGQLLWQIPSEQPTQGASPCQPASDGTNVYALQSLEQSEVGAYNAHNGTLLWKQALDDTFNFTPPLVVDSGTLYVAGDHTLYALDSHSGSQLWEIPRAMRSLQIEKEGQVHLLVGAAAQGLVAVQAATGAIAWTFNGQPGPTLSSTQFYQAAIGQMNQNNIVYTTGIAWKIPEVQQEVWLYALDASKGTPLWSRQIASGVESADAARTLPLHIDERHGIVVLQQHFGQNDTRITAFDTRTGTQRWSVPLDTNADPAPGLVQPSNGPILLFAAAHSIPQQTRLFMQIVIALGTLGLLLLWLIPLQQGLQRLQTLLRTILHLPHYALCLVKLIIRLWRFSRTLAILGLLFVLFTTGMLEGIQISQPQGHLYQVAARTGAVQWQESLTTPIQTAKLDTQGSISNVDIVDNLHQLQARKADGSIAWKTFASEGTFALPSVSARPGTVLVTLSGQVTPNYQFAPDDPAYPHPLDSLLVMSMLDRASGKTLWQNILVPPNTQQSMVILGADNKSIYVASTHNDDTGASEVSLLAIDQQKGNIAWQVSGATEPAIMSHDDGDLFIETNRIIWQVAGIIYAIDPNNGQIVWRQSIANDDALPPTQIQDQIAATSDALLIMRTNGVHGLNPMTGDELWTLPSPGVGTGQTPTGVMVVDKTILIYGNGQILAFDATNQHPLWSQKQFYAIQNLKVSDDKRMLYVALLNNIEGTAPVPVVVALDMQSGTVRWTFQPQEMQSISNAQSDGFQYSHGQLFITGCISSEQVLCKYEQLYALDAQTGEVHWKTGGESIADVDVSADGTKLQFRVISSQWQDLLALPNTTLYHE